ncbi:MAG: Bifunctional oligoribonuclease and PAP phosphatase NrnA [Turneriella sp.]|nr:Bifunctional oligoribonuclease and PAP phosphatase NrnA [Turneriella sp.]
MKAEKETQQISAQIASGVLKAYKPSSSVLSKIASLIKKHNKFLLTTHVSADADGLGSQIGFYYLLKALKKDVKILNNEPVPEFLSPFIPLGLVEYLGEGGLSPEKAEKFAQGRFVFILDSSEPLRSDKVGALFTKMNLAWATIDHHVLPDKEEFCVDPTYAATAELIWDLYKYLKIKITPKAALALYAGLVADSGNFRYPKTSLRTHLAAGDLIGYGIHSDFVFRAIYEAHPLDRLKLMARLLPKVEILPNKVALLVVTQQDLEGLALEDSGTEGVVNYLLAHKGLRVAALLKESEEGFLKASLRSIGDVDVASVAKKFGGGGHKNAAGLKMRELFQDAQKKVIAALKEI